jgi:PTH2 family peptidyl-tRNA hydrolase
MGKGKVASQCAHASIAAYLNTSYFKRKVWVNSGMKKVVLKVSSKKDLHELARLAKREKIPSILIRDRGLTQIKSGAETALGIGPDDDKKIDKITGKLKLL